jgi:hypothetical protein
VVLRAPLAPSCNRAGAATQFLEDLFVGRTKFDERRVVATTVRMHLMHFEEEGLLDLIACAALATPRVR